MTGESRPDPARLCLTAGAGAGKTRRLVQAYLALLAEGFLPQQIVAITFTEKAADEMRGRVLAQAAELARQDGPQALQWQALLAHLEWAPISTIHSFCAALLREYGISLGLDPDFAVLDAEEFEILLQDVINEILRNALKNNSALLARLLAHYPLAGTFGLPFVLTQIYQALMVAGLSAEKARQATAQAHKDELARAPELVVKLESTLCALPDALQEKKVNRTAQYGKNIQAVINAAPEVFRHLAQEPFHGASLELLDGLLKGNWQKVNDIRQVARNNLDTLLALAALPASGALADDLLGLAGQVEAEVEAELSRRAALSFDHLLLKSRDILLNDTDALHDMRHRWRALLVDEFQDVNPVQGEIVRLLAGLDGPPVAAEVPRLFLVGDRKQSIYAFRGAQVRVFTQTMAEFGQGAGRVEALSANYRSAPGLVDFFNRLFSHIFSQNEHIGHDPGAYVEYSKDDEQSAGRKEPGAWEEPVQVLVTNGDSSSSLALWREQEAVSLAAYIRHLLEDEGILAGQVAILLRKLTSVQVFEQALGRAGVPFYTVKGRGFFACPEISDLLWALKAILDPADGAALAGLLRSPLVGLSDEALLALGWDQEGGRRGLARALAAGAALPNWLGPDQQARWEKAQNLINKFAGLARRLQPAEVLGRLIEATDLMPLVLALPGGEQKAANLRKLIETARQPPTALAGGVEGFVQGLAALVDNPPLEAQAPLLGEDASVVRIMSVHQAKGLQFPVVILADLAGKPERSDFLPPMGPSGVLAAAPRDPVTNQTIKSKIYHDLRNREKAKQEAESARLFYVACTRAKERLVFSLCPEAKQQTAWGKWVRELVLNDQAARQVPASSLPEAQAEAGRPVIEAWPEMLPLKPGVMAGEGAAVVGRCLKPRRPSAPLVRESISALEDWFFCPRKYLFTRHLGVDTASLPGRAAPSTGPGAALGSRVHRLLELTDLWAGREGLAQAAEMVFGQDQADPAEKARVMTLAAGLWDTELPRLWQNLPPEAVLREQKFRLHLSARDGFPCLEVLGELDLVIISSDNLYLVDYKVTDNLHTDDYLSQLAMYCLALWRGREKKGPLPRAALCQLGGKGGRLAYQDFTAADLEAWEARLYQAGRDLARLGPAPKPADLAVGPGCTPGCALARAGICDFLEKKA